MMVRAGSRLRPEMPLASAPMTYMSGGKQYIVVAIGGVDTEPEFSALALP
jgi:hypothetical protein